MNSDGDFFTGIDQTEITAGEITLPAPAFYRQVQMMLAVFTADLAVARDLLPSERFRPLTLLPGRALIGVNCFEYGDTPVGRYNEVSISIGIQIDQPWLPPSLAVARSTLSQDFHAHILTLPVNTEIAWRVGVEIFSYPKFLADIRFTEVGPRRRCDVQDRETGALIFAFEGEKLRTRSRPRDEATFHSYPIIDGSPAHARMRVNQLERGGTMLGRGFRIQLGEHEGSRSLAALSPGRLLQYTYVPRSEAILYAPVPL